VCCIGKGGGAALRHTWRRCGKVSSSPREECAFKPPTGDGTMPSGGGSPSVGVFGRSAAVAAVGVTQAMWGGRVVVVVVVVLVADDIK
jgi:hypothetical protein